MPRVIITGSAGFLGQHIALELELHGWEVCGLDLQYSQFHDLRYPEIVEQRFDEVEDVDLCIHLAAKVGRLFGEDNPMETIVDNVGITSLVALSCRDRGIRMAYASTSEIYGDNADAICDEEDGPFTLPHNMYGISKGFGEQVCEHYVPDGLICFRFSMPYGPGLPAGRGRAAIINMLHQAVHRKQIPVHIGAERSWCYVGDTARAVRMIIESGDEGSWNVGRDDNPTQMLDVARIACDLVGAPLNLIEEVPAPQMQTVVKRLSTEKLRALGWSPQVDLREGMQKTLEWVNLLDQSGAVVAC